MQMTPLKLIVLRLYNITLGRSAFFSRLLRSALVRVLIRGQGRERKYMASSRFFDVADLHPADSHLNDKGRS